MKFNIKITETLSKIIEVSAPDEEQACFLAHEAYDNGEIILDYSDFDVVDFDIVDVDTV